MATRFIPSDSVARIAVAALSVALAAYFVTAARVVYGGSVIGAIARLGVASAAYFVAFAGALAAIFGLTVLAF